MKKIILVFTILSIAILGVYSQATTPVRTTSETIGFWTMKIPNDTMNIKYSDAIIKVSIYVPSFSADSVKLTGCTFTVDGIATNGITIPPGEASVDIGFNYNYLDTIKIVTKTTGIAWVMLFKKRK
jgi:hypothetical protein